MNKKEFSKVALVPARSGSKRIRDKNIKMLGTKPLLAHTIETALDSGVFDHVICVTDSERYAEIAKQFGAYVPELRPKQIYGDKSPDIDWLQWILGVMQKHKIEPEILAILRPTSPFRNAQTIVRAMNMFLEDGRQDSLRAVQEVAEHPGKMWTKHGSRILPLLPFTLDGTPWHSHQYANLPKVYVQNASLEIVWTDVVLKTGSIAGSSVMPFLTEGIEGFDINRPEDWLIAEHYFKMIKE